MGFLIHYVTGTGLILAVLIGWVGVQHWYRKYAARHPEYGPAQECMGCGMACSCDTSNDRDRGEHT